MKKKEEAENHILSRIDNMVAASLACCKTHKVVAGISGGADSVAMLRALLRNGVQVKAVHCNFHLRGEESQRDMRFVKQLCDKLGVSLDTVDFDVTAYRKENGGSVEMACRELRYNYFKKKLEEYGADRIAVAHNSDDNAETLLLNLFRGAGIAGLRGMKMDTGRIIRPLLSVSRKEIEGYLEALRQTYIVDSTNLSSDYRRNFIRNEIIPLIEREWPDVKRSLNHTSRIMAFEEEGMDEMLKDMIHADAIAYESLQRPIAGKWLLRRFVTKKGGADHIVNEIARSLDKDEIRIGAKWIVADGEFIFGREGLEWVATSDSPKEGIGIVSRFIWECFDNSIQLLEEIKGDKSNKFLWTNIPPEEVEIRKWIEGDRIKPLGMRGSRLVSDVIGEGKLSSKSKRDIALAVERSTGEILWVEGLKRSRKALVSPEDKKIWRLRRK